MSKRNYTEYTKEYATDIPIIQRDYVQGSDANAEKRDSFIKMILDNLAGRGSEDSANANLDFIYGTTYEDSSKDSGFMPIDGQQRLTTLALIGWLLAQKSEPGKYKMPELRYRTRHTTEQFCKCLSEYKLPDEYGNLREHLLAEPLWMAERWLSDPSVSAMLDLLSAVDTKLKSAEYKDCIEEMANNFFTHNPISFFLLDMNNPLDKEKDHSSNVKAENDGFKLSEDLYIKMNARGKLLTPFENWKAQFTGMLESRFRNVPYEYQAIQGQTISIPEYFSYAIEHEWTDLLWPGARDDWEKLSPEERKEHPYPRIDEYFMKLLDYFTEIFYWEGFVNEGSIKTTHDRLKKNFPGIELSEMFSGEKHQWIGRRRISVYRNQENVIKLFRMLDALVMLSKNEGVKGLDTFFNSILSHGEWDITSENISVSEEMN
ncbi:MAG: DUF262 domain-containing protein, partial [Muribaculaceae bacterium]|nr:DUF262 domain-containing protein [Muribaculaceae bacterium]